jgi:putative ABC transport system ATP-binding protein
MESRSLRTRESDLPLLIMAIIEIKNVRKHFIEGGQTVAALDGVSMQIEEGSFVSLSGPSGSGKTTLLNLMGCLDKPTEGQILLDGEEVSGLSQQKLTNFRLRKIGFIFQDFNLIPTLSAVENIEYVLWLQGTPSAERRKRALEICERFSITHLIHRKPTQLSRGQQQRVAVARAIAHKPRIVLGDELTANLDHKTGAELMDFLKELNRKEKMTFLYATHDPIMIERAGRIIRMQDGKMVEGGVRV